MKPITIKNPLIYKIISAILMAIFGFILLNAAFILDFLYQSIITFVFGLIIPAPVLNESIWFPPLMQVSFLLILFFITKVVLKLKIKDFYKAIFLMVPVAAVYVTIGMSFYRFPVVSLILSTIFFVLIFRYLYKAKKDGFYFYSLILISLAMAIGSIFQMQI